MPLQNRFGRGDLVQYSRLGIMRQQRSMVPKTEDTRGKYYGPAGRDAAGRIYAWVDWFVSEPFERTIRQRVREDYLESLGVSR